MIGGRVLLSSLAGACSFPTLAPHFAEGTETLHPKQLGVTVAAGGAAGRYTISDTRASSVGGGMELRVRVGLPKQQEVRASGIAGVASKTTGEPPVALGGELSYKLALLPWLAVTAGVGVLDKVISSTTILGGSLGVIVAPYTARGGTQFYTGAKGSVTVPILEGATGSAELIGVPVGLAWHATTHVRLFVEGGFLLGFGRINSGGTTTNTSGFGGYGLVAFGYVFR
jgi:hypothetical protein